MEHGVRERFFLFLALCGLLVAAVSGDRAVRTGVPISLKTIKGHLHLLRQCRRQLTFIASAALGAFITRVIADSPLTPLPMPPAKDPSRWTFWTLPLHAADPFRQWMQQQSYSMQPESFNQAIDLEVPLTWRRESYEESTDTLSWTRAPRVRRHTFNVARFVKSSPGLIAKAVSRAIHSIGSSLLSQDASTRQWLMRLCF